LLGFLANNKSDLIRWKPVCFCSKVAPEERKLGGSSFTATQPGIIATIYLSPCWGNSTGKLFGHGAAPRQARSGSAEVKHPVFRFYLVNVRFDTSLWSSFLASRVLSSPFRAKALPLLMAAEHSELPYELSVFS